MKVFFDTNVILDVLLDRQPFSEPASFLLTKIEQSEIIGILASTTITTVHYLSQKAVGREKANIYIGNLLSLFEIAPVNRIVLKAAVESNFSDFEDAVLHEAACQSEADYIISRDKKGFKKSALPVYSPGELVKMLEALSRDKD